MDIQYLFYGQYHADKKEVQSVQLRTRSRKCAAVFLRANAAELGAWHLDILFRVSGDEVTITRLLSKLQFLYLSRRKTRSCHAPLDTD